MLKDALESPDLDKGVLDKSAFDNHPILKHFKQLSDAAISHAQYPSPI